MKKYFKLDEFLYGLALGMSIMFIPLCFVLGDLERGYNATGGEVFTIALPFLVLCWRRWSIRQK